MEHSSEVLDLWIERFGKGVGCSVVPGIEDPAFVTQDGRRRILHLRNGRQMTGFAPLPKKSGGDIAVHVLVVASNNGAIQCVLTSRFLLDNLSVVNGGLMLNHKESGHGEGKSAGGAGGG
jgi:hypothetical protein